MDSPSGRPTSTSSAIRAGAAARRPTAKIRSSPAAWASPSSAECRATISNHLRAVATSKHFAVHSGPEQLRHGFNVDPSPRDLEETYLPAFRATVTEGHVQSVMCAYNSIDELPACTNKMLLKEHLRDAWGFKGFVVSDCGAIVDVNQGHKKDSDIEHSVGACRSQAGTDLSCSIWTPGFNTLADAVRQGLVTEDLVTQAAERLYTARFQLGLFDPQGSNPLDKIPFSDARFEANRADRSQGRRREHRAAEERRRAAAEERPGTHRGHRTDRRSAALHPRQLRRHARCIRSRRSTAC